MTTSTDARGPRGAIALALAGALAMTAGCGRAPSAPSSGIAPLSPADEDVLREVNLGLSEIINEESQRHEPLQYDYNEDLLEKLDQIAAHLSARSAEADADADGTPVRFFPKLTEQGEREHLRETVRRWEARTGRDIRATIDPLQAEVAARDPDEAFHPDFQRRFSEAFDSFIKVEVDEMHERRNRAIHERVDALLDPHREAHPEVVRRIDALLNEPPYDLPEGDPDPVDLGGKDGDGGGGDAGPP